MTAPAPVPTPPRPAERVPADTDADHAPADRPTPSERHRYIRGECAILARAVARTLGGEIWGQFVGEGAAEDALHCWAVVGDHAVDIDGVHAAPPVTAFDGETAIRRLTAADLAFYTGGRFRAYNRRRALRLVRRCRRYFQGER